jgi:selenocysteine lyase/cysteine desulfurase/tRNA(Ile)-lysidine synthase TilS/MesJ
MECGTSLAEDAWTIDDNPLPPPSAAALSSSPTSSPASSSAEAIWSGINNLRARLASDIIFNSHQNNNSNNEEDELQLFPTFTSPSYDGRSGTGGMNVPLIYCDHTASHRPVHSLETYIRTVSMPCHANTHTNITYTGSQSTAFVAESRQIVAEMTGARITGKAATDVVLFGGNGTTGVVSLLLDVLNLRGLAAAASAATTASASAANNITNSSTRPVVFVGPHEHHSNLLPWRESGCEVVTISERPSDGTLDIDELERTLHLPQYRRYSGRLRIGAFAAVSNVTGLIAHVDRIAILLHKHDALAFFDYASGAPYLKMDMNPPPESSRSSSNNDNTTTSDDDPSKDAIYFSPHKLYGGTSTPGVLVIKKHLISQTSPPSVSGGGTVFYVTSQSHRFLSNRIERYEGGTPDGIGIQRVGLALLIGRKVASEYERIVASLSHDGTSLLEDRTSTTPTLTIPTLPPKTLLEYECSTYDRVVIELKRHAPNLIILGRHNVSHDDTNNNNDNNTHVHEGISNNTQSSSSTSSCVGRHLPIFSFLIRCGRRFLHYNYVCAILNDVFGVQSRGGCQCAGPYSQRLLGLTSNIRIKNNTAADDIVDDYKLMEVPSETNRQIELALLRSDRPCELLRPGYTRLSLPFKGLREEEVDYVIKALIWVAKNGWALLPQYRCDHRTGEWRHWSRRGKPLGKSERLWLSNYDILASSPTAASRPMKHCDTTLSNDSINQASRVRLNSAMENADAILRSTKSDPRFLSEAERMNPASGLLGSGGSHDDSGDGGVDHTLEELRWYVYPQEVSQYLREGLDEPPDTCDDDALIGAIDVRMDGKRRRNNLIDDDGSAVMLLEGDTAFTPPLQTGATVTLQGSNLIPFQEGDHVGEALYDDIKTGYEEGELGEACEVYSTELDVWLPIARFLQEYVPDEVATIAGAVINEESASHRKRNLSVMKDSLPSCIDSSPGSDVLPLLPLPPAIEKREKKKPSRDSSQWGQYSMPITAPPPRVHDSPSKLAETATALSTVEPSSQVATAMSNKSMKNKGKIKPPPKLMRYVTQAMIQWDMIQEGDRLLLGLSGGKDSLSLLHILLEWQRKSPIKFDIEVCTIDPLTPSFDPSPLIPYVEGLGLKYHYIRDDIVQRATSSGKDGKTVSSLCAFCARMKRGNLYTTARRNNCNKLVLAQHLDDCAESFFMSIMHNGFVRTMKANYKINAGDVSVIRPLVYCRESLMTEFAKNAHLPVINENCPACFEEPKERARIKKLLSREETLYTNLYDNVRRALIPVMHDDSTSIMRSYLEETIAKSRKTRILNDLSTKEEEKKSEELDISQNNLSLSSASEEDLIAELARRKAAKYKYSGASPANKRMSSNKDEDEDCIEIPVDETGQMCSLLGGRDGSIPCRELME